MTYKNGAPSSDSVNLGSNPSSPATRNARSSSLSEFVSYLENLDKPEQIAHARRTNVGTGGVYIIRGFRDDMIKVGKTHNLANRLNGLQQATPHKLKVLFFEEYGDRAAEVEKGAHKLLRPWRVQGEWFRVSEALAKIAVEGARDKSAHTTAFFALQCRKLATTDKRIRQGIERRILAEFTDLHDRLPKSDCEVVVWR